jgi:hypothetical protein
MHLLTADGRALKGSGYGDIDFYVYAASAGRSRTNEPSTDDIKETRVLASGAQ